MTRRPQESTPQCVEGAAPQVPEEVRAAQRLVLAHSAVLLRTLEGEVLYWSEGAQALYGWSAEQALGRGTCELLGPGALDAAAQAQLLAAGRWCGEREHRTREGAPVAVHALWVLSVDAQGRRTVLESFRDLSAQRAREQAQRETLALLDGILEAAPVGLCFIDAGLRFVRVNPALAGISGVPVEHTVGRRLREVVGEVMADVLEPVVRFVLESGEPVLEREVAGNLPGAPQRRAWRVSHFPVKEAEGRVRVVGMVVQDITQALREQVRTARLQATTSALSHALTPEDVARVVLTEAVQELGARRGLAFLHHPEDGTLRALAPVGYAEQVPERFQVLRADDLDQPFTDALRTGEPIYLESLEQLLQRYPRFVPLPPGQASAAWALLPMQVDARPVGALLLSFAQERVLSAQDRSFLRVLTQQCALALERARRHSEA